MLQVSSCPYNCRICLLSIQPIAKLRMCLCKKKCNWIVQPIFLSTNSLSKHDLPTTLMFTKKCKIHPQNTNPNKHPKEKTQNNTKQQPRDGPCGHYSLFSAAFRWSPELRVLRAQVQPAELSAAPAGLSEGA